MKKLLLPIMALGFLMMGGTASATKIDFCHCPNGHQGKKCVNIRISSTAATFGHRVNHYYDHAGVCTAEELSDDTISPDIGSGTDEEGFSVPKTTGSNWREQ